MPMRAVVRIGGSQYFVKEGDVLKTQLPAGKTGEIEITDVFLVEKDGEITIGRPRVAGASVRAVVVGEKRGRKLRVLKYKSKTRYRKHIGFRALITTLKIQKISI